MVKHIVVWKLRDEADGRDRQGNALLIRERLLALRGVVPGLLHLEVGFDFSASLASGDVVLYSEFRDRASLEAYQSHPEHEAVRPFIGAVSSERRVVDYEVG